MRRHYTNDARWSVRHSNMICTEVKMSTRGHSWCSDIQSPAWRRTMLPQFAGTYRRRAWSTSTPLFRIEPSADSAVQTVNRRRSSVSGRNSTALEQAAGRCHVGQNVVGFSAATETHFVPAVIPRHYYATFLNCNTHSGPCSGLPHYRPL